MTSPTRLLIATRNHGKLRELSDLLGSVPFELVSLSDEVGIDVDVEETGLDVDTFEDNAVLKAETYRDLSGLLTLADDSGLEVDALGGEPGVRSKWRGMRVTCAKFRDGRRPNPASAEESRSAPWCPPRKPRGPAQFSCVIAIASPGNEETRLFMVSAGQSGTVSAGA